MVILDQAYCGEKIRGTVVIVGQGYWGDSGAGVLWW